MAAADSNKFQTKVGVVGATAVVIGNMIGTGVFVSLGFQVGSVTSGFPLLLLWVVGGFYALFGSFCYAELAAAFPRSGGEYHLLSRVFHPAVGFMSGWLSMTVGFAAPIAVASMAFGSYLGDILGMEPAIFSCALVVLVTGVHLWRLRFASGFQSVFTGGKVVLLLVLIACAFLMATAQDIRFLPVEGDLAQIGQKSFAVSLIFVTFAYSGWNAAAYIAGEVKNPGRNVPLALIVGTLVVTVLYVLVNAAFLHSTPIAELGEAKEKVALVAARSIFGEGGGNLMGLLIAFGLISAVSAMTWAGPRTGMAAGEDYRALRLLGRKTERGIPAVAILLQSAITLVLVLTKNPRAVLVYVEFALMLSVTVTVAGVIWLRIKKPDIARPFRTPLYPLTPILFIAMNGWILYWTLEGQRKESLLSLATVGSGLLVWGIVVYFSKSKTEPKEEERNDHGTA